jgi:hypothetical protein
MAHVRLLVAWARAFTTNLRRVHERITGRVITVLLRNQTRLDAPRHMLLLLTRTPHHQLNRRAHACTYACRPRPPSNPLLRSGSDHDERPT